jgi:integrase
MAGIYLRGSVWWGRWRDGGGKIVRESMGTTDRAEALKRAQAREAEDRTSVAPAGAVDLGDWSIGRVLDGYLEHVAVRYSDKPGTLTAYRSRVRTFSRWASRPANAFPSEELTVYQREGIARGLSPRTINHRLMTFLCALKWAKEDAARTGVHEVPECKPLPEIKERIPAALETDQQVALLRHVRDTELEPVIRLGLWCGLRREEIVRLRWDVDVDLTNALVHVQARKAVTAVDNGKLRMIYTAWSPKNRKSRSIPIEPEAVAWLKAYRERLKAAGWLARRGDPVCSRCYGRMWRTNNLSARIAEVFAELGIRSDEEHTLHMLRHTFAFAMLEHGVDIENLRDLMGHANIGTTAIYTRATAKSKRRAVEGYKLPA